MGPGDEAGKSDENGFRNDTEMKIIIFPVKYDKFTGFCDKLLKISDYANDCNKRSYHRNLSVPHSDPARKKVFRAPAHLPATARICAPPPRRVRGEARNRAAPSEVKEEKEKGRRSPRPLSRPLARAFLTCGG